MAETMIFQPKPIEGMIKVPASADSGKLDQEVKTFCRGQFAIGSASYYQVAGEIPWLAISKSIQNQMAAKSIERTMFDWYEPGIDFIEIYPQGKNGGAFALAMPKESNLGADKLIGFYILTSP
ncbi:hypothetical protein [uncultured Desulfobacter sp.]|uniref:hypothetical protein n=1 Tax=uncultured Desulfobacter sp. TaxID=240139 RepID=UPI0029F522B9|nr:hypothetical protein [uncultured Desulfobacter sp.]